MKTSSRPWGLDRNAKFSLFELLVIIASLGRMSSSFLAALHSCRTCATYLLNFEKVAVSPSNSMTVTKLQARLAEQIITYDIHYYSMHMMTACSFFIGSHVLIVLKFQLQLENDL